MLGTVLLVEDDEGFRRGLRRFLSQLGFEVFEAENCAAARSCLGRSETPSLVLSDVSLPDGLGFEVLEEVQRRNEPPPVIIMAGEERIDYAIRALQMGASDFLCKPFPFEALEDAIRRQLDFDAEEAAPRACSLRPEPANEDAVLQWRDHFVPEMLGRHPEVLRVLRIMERVADTDCTTLVTGESGTGKELVARALHRASSRASKPFVTINCAAIPENLLESELFGHVRGAFTGAIQNRIGRFTAADGGTIFLDEIGELPLALQAKLLRVLQDKEVTPVGDVRSHRVDVRVIAATNRELEHMVEEHRFRQDLMYRLNVIPITLPALRERRSDVPLLIASFMERFNRKKLQGEVRISEEAIQTLVAYPWPGNVRELENTIERLVVLKGKGTIELGDLDLRLRKEAAPALSSFDSPQLPEEGLDLRDAVERFENALIMQALERSGWNKNRAALILRMNRTTLVEKLKKKNFSDRALA